LPRYRHCAFLSASRTGFLDFSDPYVSIAELSKNFSEKHLHQKFAGVIFDPINFVYIQKTAMKSSHHTKKRVLFCDDFQAQN
jgi:hypothetical protein